ncbi:MAG: hypothetical protein EA352_02460 [Gemmatimonadales bacterium]|nr:MAG: hypothetical protein EA352_02460 [Gemmatimonadales bacterium]
MLPDRRDSSLPSGVPDFDHRALNEISFEAGGEFCLSVGGSESHVEQVEPPPLPARHRRTTS